MNILFLIGLIFSSLAHGASSSVTIEVDEEREQSIQLFRKSQDATGESTIIEQRLCLKKKDPFVRKSFSELRQLSNDKNMPWIVCDFNARSHIDLFEFKPKRGCFDLSAMLRKRSESKRDIDLTTFTALSATIVKEFQHQFSMFKLSEFGIHIIDREGKMIGFIFGSDKSGVQGYICSQLKYSLHEDLAALKHMITMYSEDKFCTKGAHTIFDRDAAGEAYVTSWCATYLAKHPDDEDIRNILASYQNKDQIAE